MAVSSVQFRRVTNEDALKCLIQNYLYKNSRPIEASVFVCKPFYEYSGLPRKSPVSAVNGGIKRSVPQERAPVSTAKPVELLLDELEFPSSRQKWVENSLTGI